MIMNCELKEVWGGDMGFKICLTFQSAMFLKLCCISGVERKIEITADYTM
jgi:hypothetical protein